MLELEGNWNPQVVHMKAEDVHNHFFVLWKDVTGIIGGGRQGGYILVLKPYMIENLTQ